MALRQKGAEADIPLSVNHLRIQGKGSYIVQLAKSSRAIHGGAYFSAVCGRKLIPINAPGPYECQECNRLLFSPPGATFFLPYIHMYIGSAALRAFQMDLC